MTQKIKDILSDPKTVLVFDIDGTLAKYEYGIRNHRACRDSQWKTYLRENKVYDKAEATGIFKPFINAKPERVFVCTVVSGIEEIMQKKAFLKKHFPEIPSDNIYFISSQEDKIVSLFVIQCEFTDVSAKDIYMIDDSSMVLNNIQDRTDFGTIHISSFLDS